MLRFFNPLAMLNASRVNAVPRRFVWESIVNARPPVRQQDVLDRSVLRAVGSSYVSVLDRASLHAAGSKISGGRSRGHKLMRQLPDGTREFFYFKLPFYRWGFVKELIVGALARELMGSLAPRVYAVEMLDEKTDKQARYGLASQSLGSNLHYDNLESWSFLYKEDEEELVFGPRHLGCSLAFKFLLGDSDVKSANIVMLRDQQGHCYPIDNEYCFDRKPQFITTADAAVRLLNDFQPADADTHHLPLQSEPDLLKKIFPVFTAAVQLDIDNGDIFKLYSDFANLSLSRLHGLFNQFGPLIHADERACLLKDLLARQQETLKFVVGRDSNMLSGCGTNKRIKV